MPPDDGMLPDSERPSQLAGSEVAQKSRIEAHMKIVPPEPSVDLYDEGFEEPDILQQQGNPAIPFPIF